VFSSLQGYSDALTAKPIFYIYKVKKNFILYKMFFVFFYNIRDIILINLNAERKIGMKNQYRYIYAITLDISFHVT
jgi:hypothetical protein